MLSSRMRTVRNSSRQPGGGVLAPRGVSAHGGVYSRGSACSWGVSAPGGCLLLGRACSWGGGCLLLGKGWYPSMHLGRPPCRQTDKCKNITFATSVR